MLAGISRRSRGSNMTPWYRAAETRATCNRSINHRESAGIARGYQDAKRLLLPPEMGERSAVTH